MCVCVCVPLTQVIVSAESDILPLHWRVRDNRYVADCKPRIVAILTFICSDVKLMCVTKSTSIGHIYL